MEHIASDLSGETTHARNSDTSSAASHILERVLERVGPGDRDRFGRSEVDMDLAQLLECGYIREREPEQSP